MNDKCINCGMDVGLHHFETNQCPLTEHDDGRWRQGSNFLSKNLITNIVDDRIKAILKEHLQPEQEQEDENKLEERIEDILEGYDALNVTTDYDYTEDCYTAIDVKEAMKELIKSQFVIAYKKDMKPQRTKPNETFCKCEGGPTGRCVTEDFEHQICDTCGKFGS